MDVLFGSKYQPGTELVPDSVFLEASANGDRHCALIVIGEVEINVCIQIKAKARLPHEAEITLLFFI